MEGHTFIVIWSYFMMEAPFLGFVMEGYGARQYVTTTTTTTTTTPSPPSLSFIQFSRSIHVPTFLLPLPPSSSTSYLLLLLLLLLLLPLSLLLPPPMR